MCMFGDLYSQLIIIVMSNHYTAKIIGPMHAYSYMKNLYKNHMFVCICESIQGKASGAI